MTAQIGLGLGPVDGWTEYRPSAVAREGTAEASETFLHIVGRGRRQKCTLLLVSQ